jgi:hypothetical protein
MTYVASVSLVLVAIIRLMPVTGVSGLRRNEMSYGITPGDAYLRILMRHRAVLFGVLGAFL